MVFWNGETSRRGEESHQPIVCGEKRPKAFPCLLRLLRALLHLNPTVYSFGRVRGFCHSMSLNLAGVTIITINKNIAISLLIEPQLTESFSCAAFLHLPNISLRNPSSKFLRDCQKADEVGELSEFHCC